MKVSRREKTMLSFLGLLVGGFLYYEFGFLALNDYAEKENQTKQTLEKRYQDAENTINTKDIKLENIKIFNAKIGNEVQPFFPTINQENIILELDDLIKESGLYGGLKFKDEEVKSVEVIKKSDKDKELQNSSILDIVNQYNSKFGTDEDKKTANNTLIKDNTSKQPTSSGNANNSTGSTASSNGNNTTQGTDGKNDKDAKTVGQIKIDVEFNGTYENLIKFLGLLKNNNYNNQFQAYQITMSEKNIDEIKGTISIIAYAIPKLDINTENGKSELTNYLDWKLNGTYGKDKPFTVNSASGTGIELKKGPDFLVSVKSANSDLPSITMGRANDTLRSSYIYADDKANSVIEIELTKKADKYYYKYKSNNQSVPEDYNGLGNEFIPNSDNIEINIQSEIRRGTNDQSGLKLKVTNKTDIIVNVNVNGDDTASPRISLDADITNVHLNKE